MNTQPIPTSNTPTSTPTPTSDITEFPFLVKVLITFTRLNAQGNEEKFKDDVVFKLDRPSAKMPWYVLRNYSVPKYLTQKYGPMEVAWQRIYEIKILKLINRQDPSDISDIPLRVMTLSQLQEYTQRWELNVDPYEFYSVEKAREMIALRQQDPLGYQKHVQEYREGKQRSFPELDNMRKGTPTTLDTNIDNEFELLDKQSETLSKPKKRLESFRTAEVSSTQQDIGLMGQTSTTPNPGVKKRKSRAKTPIKVPATRKSPFSGV